MLRFPSNAFWKTVLLLGPSNNLQSSSCTKVKNFLFLLTTLKTMVCFYKTILIQFSITLGNSETFWSGHMCEWFFTPSNRLMWLSFSRCIPLFGLQALFYICYHQIPMTYTANRQSVNETLSSGLAQSDVGHPIYTLWLIFTWFVLFTCSPYGICWYFLVLLPMLILKDRKRRMSGFLPHLLEGG